MFKLLNMDPDNYSEKALSVLKEICEIDSYQDGSPPLEAIIEKYDILLLRFSRVIDKTLINSASKLKVIACNATGTDHIDAAAAAEKGIQILSLKGEREFLDTVHATAELTWGLLLSLVREIPRAIEHVNSGGWNRDLFLTRELSNKTLGILGFGRIGSKIARYADAFGMNVVAYDPYVSTYPEYVKRIAEFSEFISQSELLSIHVPLNAETKNMLTATELKLLPKGAYAVNTSRGDVLNEEDVISLLNSGHISGIAVDVLSNEFQIGKEKQVLIDYAQQHNNVLITPHIGGVTKESWEKTELFIANKIVNYLQGISP